MKEKKIRVGVLGSGRGMAFAQGAGELVGMELVALCDKWVPGLKDAERRLAAGGKTVTTYTDYEKFLEHDFDAVILANYFHEHAPFAVRALAAGKHVMSETSACFTMAQGVALGGGGGAQRKDLHVRRELSLYGVQPGDAAAVSGGQDRDVHVRRGGIRSPGAGGFLEQHCDGRGSLAQLAAGDVLLHARAGAGDVHYRYPAGQGERIRDPARRRTTRCSSVTPIAAATRPR